MTKRGLSLVKQEAPAVADEQGNALTQPSPASLQELSQSVTRHVRSSKNRTMMWTYLLFVLVPSLLYGAYLAVWATPAYQSEFRVLVRSSNSGMKGFDLSQVLGAAGGKSSEDPYAVIQYITSQQAVTDLQKRFDIKSHYASGTVDLFSRLSEGETQEGVARYLKDYIDAYYESTTGTVIATVKAFDPQVAQRIARELLTLSEELVNRMSDRSRRDLVSFSERSVAEAERRLQAISQQLLDLRNKGGVLDPQKYAAVNIERVAKLQDEIGELRAQLAVQRGYLSEDAPSIQLNVKRIEALEGELQAANAKITSSDPQNTTVLSQTLRDFEQVQTEREFAQKSYQASLVALQSAQADAARQALYLDTIIAPSLAEEQSYPKPLKDAFVFIAILSCAWAFLLLLGSSVRDHIS